ncbi:MAG: CPBP family intramembrane glutamic endopeptidase, partial [Dehalococcoidia bacterium]
AVEYLIIHPKPLAAAFGLGIVFPALVLIATTGFVEELVFRGIMQRAFIEGVGRRGIIYVSVVFAVLHIGYLFAADVAFVFVVSLFFAWMRERTGSLLGISLAHGITNAVLYLVAPFWVTLLL